MPRKEALIALGIAVCLLETGPAAVLLGNSEKAFGVNGSVRTLGAVVDNYDFPLLFGPDNEVSWLSQSLLRLIVAGKPTGYFSYEVHGTQDLLANSDKRQTSGNGSGARTLFSKRDEKYRALDATWQWLNEEHVEANLAADRFNARISAPFLDVTAGRQAISFGKTFFWSPLDVFSPFSSQQIDRDYKIGVDAARLDIPFNTVSGVNIVGALGRTIGNDGRYQRGDEDWEVSWYGSAALARFFTTLKSWDLSLQGGKVYGGYQVGAGTVGEVGPLQIRGEWTYTFAEEDGLRENEFLSVIGLGHRFENTLDLQFEYFYNGSGETKNLNAALLRQVRGETLQLSEHVLGFLGSYEVTPIINARLAALFSPVASPSAQLQPSVSFSLSNEAELILGAICNLGERPSLLLPLSPMPSAQVHSEFGLQPDIYFAEVKLFF